MSLSRTRQTVVPFTTPINGLNMFTKSDAIRGGFNGYYHHDMALIYQTGSWSLDPLAPQVPAPNLVQTSLDGQREKKKCRRSRSSKTTPPTARLATRQGGIHASFRVLGDPFARSIATIRAESRKGSIVLELVSQYLAHRVPLFRPNFRSLSLRQGRYILMHIHARVRLIPIPNFGSLCHLV
jgi:hypothetical protein